MENYIITISSFVLYKVVCLFVGLAFGYMGYKLFIKKIWGEAGDLTAQFGDNKILLKAGAPGTFFALFGAIIIGVTVWKGIEFWNKSEKLLPNVTQQIPRDNLEPLPDALQFINGEKQ